MLVAMSLTFVACEPGNVNTNKQPESNCDMYQSQYTDLGDGTALFEITHF